MFCFYLLFFSELVLVPKIDIADFVEIILVSTVGGKKKNKLVNFLRFRNRKFRWGRPWPWFVQNINLFQRSKPIRFSRKLKNELAYLTLQTRIHTKELPPKASKRTGNAYHLKNDGPEWQVDVDAFNLKEGLDLDISFTFNCYIRSFRSADLQGRP